MSEGNGMSYSLTGQGGQICLETPRNPLPSGSVPDTYGRSVHRQRLRENPLASSRGANHDSRLRTLDASKAGSGVYTPRSSTVRGNPMNLHTLYQNREMPYFRYEAGLEPIERQRTDILDYRPRSRTPLPRVAMLQSKSTSRDASRSDHSDRTDHSVGRSYTPFFSRSCLPKGPSYNRSFSKGAEFSLSRGIDGEKRSLMPGKASERAKLVHYPKLGKLNRSYSNLSNYHSVYKNYAKRAEQYHGDPSLYNGGGPPQGYRREAEYGWSLAPSHRPISPSGGEALDSARSYQSQRRDGGAVHTPIYGGPSSALVYDDANTTPRAHSARYWNGRIASGRLNSEEAYYQDPSHISRRPIPAHAHTRREDDQLSIRSLQTSHNSVQEFPRAGGYDRIGASHSPPSRQLATPRNNIHTGETHTDFRELDTAGWPRKDEDVGNRPWQLTHNASLPEYAEQGSSSLQRGSNDEYHSRAFIDPKLSAQKTQLPHINSHEPIKERYFTQEDVSTGNNYGRLMRMREGEHTHIPEALRGVGQDESFFSANGDFTATPQRDEKAIGDFGLYRSSMEHANEKAYPEVADKYARGNESHTSDVGSLAQSGSKYSYGYYDRSLKLAPTEAEPHDSAMAQSRQMFTFNSLSSRSNEGVPSRYGFDPKLESLRSPSPQAIGGTTHPTQSATPLNTSTSSVVPELYRCSVPSSSLFQSHSDQVGDKLDASSVGLPAYSANKMMSEHNTHTHVFSRQFGNSSSPTPAASSNLHSSFSTGEGAAHRQSKDLYFGSSNKAGADWLPSGGGYSSREMLHSHGVPRFPGDGDSSGSNSRRGGLSSSRGDAAGRGDAPLHGSNSKEGGEQPPSSVAKLGEGFNGMMRGSELHESLDRGGRALLRGEAAAGMDVEYGGGKLNHLRGKGNDEGAALNAPISEIHERLKPFTTAPGSLSSLKHDPHAYEDYSDKQPSTLRSHRARTHNTTGFLPIHPMDNHHPPTYSGGSKDPSSHQVGVNPHELLSTPPFFSTSSAASTMEKGGVSRSPYTGHITASNPQTPNESSSHTAQSAALVVGGGSKNQPLPQSEMKQQSELLISARAREDRASETPQKAPLSTSNSLLSRGVKIQAADSPLNSRGGIKGGSTHTDKRPAGFQPLLGERREDLSRSSQLEHSGRNLGSSIYAENAAKKNDDIDLQLSQLMTKVNSFRSKSTLDVGEEANATRNSQANSSLNFQTQGLPPTSSRSEYTRREGEVNYLSDRMASKQKPLAHTSGLDMQAKGSVLRGQRSEADRGDALVCSSYRESQAHTPFESAPSGASTSFGISIGDGAGSTREGGGVGYKRNFTGPGYTRDSTPSAYTQADTHGGSAVYNQHLPSNSTSEAAASWRATHASQNSVLAAASRQPYGREVSSQSFSSTFPSSNNFHTHNERVIDPHFERGVVSAGVSKQPSNILNSPSRNVCSSFRGENSSLTRGDAGGFPASSPSFGGGSVSLSSPSFGEKMAVRPAGLEAEASFRSSSHQMHMGAQPGGGRSIPSISNTPKMMSGGQSFTTNRSFSSSERNTSFEGGVGKPASMVRAQLNNPGGGLGDELTENPLLHTPAGGVGSGGAMRGTPQQGASPSSGQSYSWLFGSEGGREEPEIMPGRGGFKGSSLPPGGHQGRGGLKDDWSSYFPPNPNDPGVLVPSMRSRPFGDENQSAMGNTQHANTHTSVGGDLKNHTGILKESAALSPKKQSKGSSSVYSSRPNNQALNSTNHSTVTRPLTSYSAWCETHGVNPSLRSARVSTQSNSSR